MRQHTEDQHRDVDSLRSDERDSSTIQRLIERLDRDLKETQRKGPLFFRRTSTLDLEDTGLCLRD